MLLLEGGVITQVAQMQSGTIDGNHKMIRWHFVIHGGVDGFSRTIVFLSCSDNNKGDTVLQLFRRAIEVYGLTNKIRTDQGGENTDIWRYMIEEYSSSEAVITGSSVHNERIERLWRDVSRSVSSIFINSFRTLEERNQLNPLNVADIFCLHWVYLPKINQILLNSQKAGIVTPFLLSTIRHLISCSAKECFLKCINNIHHFLHLRQCNTSLLLMTQ